MAFLFAKTDADGNPITFRFIRGYPWNDDVILKDQVSGDPVDLTGITGMMARLRVDRADTTNVLELSIENGKLVVLGDPTEGKIGIRVTSAQSLTLPQNDNENARYVTDVAIERTPGEYEPGIAAKVTVEAQVTRPTESA